MSEEFMDPSRSPKRIPNHREPAPDPAPGFCAYVNPECLGRLERIETIMQGWDRELFGNGQPGMLSRMDHRLGGLERWRWMTVGALSLLTLLCTLLGTAVLFYDHAMASQLQQQQQEEQQEMQQFRYGQSGQSRQGGQGGQAGQSGQGFSRYKNPQQGQQGQGQQGQQGEGQQQGQGQQGQGQGQGQQRGQEGQQVERGVQP